MAKGIYDWNEWFGRPRTVLVRGKHYTIAQSTMVATIRNNASMRGYRIRVRDMNDHIVLEVMGERDNYEVSHPDKTPVTR